MIPAFMTPLSGRTAIAGPVKRLAWPQAMI
jgi:hypothetical protein